MRKTAKGVEAVIAESGPGRQPSKELATALRPYVGRKVSLTIKLGKATEINYAGNLLAVTDFEAQMIVEKRASAIPLAKVDRWMALS